MSNFGQAKERKKERKKIYQRWGSKICLFQVYLGQRNCRPMCCTGFVPFVSTMCKVLYHTPATSISKKKKLGMDCPRNGRQELVREVGRVGGDSIHSRLKFIVQY